MSVAALGIVYGDLGTSPLHTFQTVVGDTGGKISADGALGGLSLTVWALILTISVKDGLLDTAFEQIRHYAVTDVVVSARLLRALDDIASTTGNAGLHRHLAARGHRVYEGCRGRLAEADLGLLRDRLDRLLVDQAPIATASPATFMERTSMTT